MRRHYAKAEDLSTKATPLQKLIAGDIVFIQDQTGKTPRQWNKSGKVLEALPHDSYLVKVDGSNRVTQRNRRFLRKFTPFVDKLKQIDDARKAVPLPYLPLPPIEPPLTPENQFPTQPHPQYQTRSPLNHQQSQLSPPTVSPDQQSQPSHPTIPTTTNGRSRADLPRHLREKWIVADKYIKKDPTVAAFASGIPPPDIYRYTVPTPVQGYYTTTGQPFVNNFYPTPIVQHFPSNPNSPGNPNNVPYSTLQNNPYSIYYGTPQNLSMNNQFQAEIAAQVKADEDSYLLTCLKIFHLKLSQTNFREGSIDST